MSGAILKLVALTEEVGLQAELGDWSEASVYWFEGLMPDQVRAAGNAVQELDYFDSEGTPHNPAGEGFIDRNAKTAISFLLDLKE